MEKINSRIEEIVALGDKAGGVSMLPDDLQEEYVRLSDIVYEYETDEYDCSWRVKSEVTPELKASIDTARQEYADGNITAMRTHEEIDDYLEKL